MTEGALKADIIGDCQEIGLAAMGGVTAVNPQKLVERLQSGFPYLEKVVLAFDMDWEIRESVKGALFRLIEKAKDAFPKVEVITWERNLGKGLDDVLNNLNNREGLNITIDNKDYFHYFAAEEFQSKFLGVEAKDITIFEEKSEESDMNVKEVNIKDEATETFGIICRDFLAMDFPNPERVMFGLGRGNVGLMIASTNIGKTTLALNLSLSVGMNKSFAPLFDETHKARKVMYIDGEATKADLQADIRKMLESCSAQEQESIKDNLYFICEEELNGEPLDLVNPAHIKIVTEKAREFNPDLIIVDTLSALTLMEDENDNAKVRKEIIQPLKSMAKATDAGVVLLHHSGKFIEGSPQAEDAYKGRGASAFGALARVVFNLKPVKNTSKVTLSCSKVKSGKFQPVNIELDGNTRWFKEVEKSVAPNSKRIHYEQVVNVVKGFGRKVKRKEIEETLKAKEIDVATSTLSKILREAVESKDLHSPSYSYYCSPINPNVEMPLKE